VRQSAKRLQTPVYGPRYYPDFKAEQKPGAGMAVPEIKDVIAESSSRCRTTRC
jgi:hypothetical protein